MAVPAAEPPPVPVVVVESPVEVSDVPVPLAPPKPVPPVVFGVSLSLKFCDISFSPSNVNFSYQARARESFAPITALPAVNEQTTCR